jgi:hypothetical protein
MPAHIAPSAATDWRDDKISELEQQLKELKSEIFHHGEALCIEVEAHTNTKDKLAKANKEIKELRKHNWKNDWPGNYCLNCGLPDPRENEDFLINCSCVEGCDKCCFTGCIANPNYNNIELPDCRPKNLED